MLNAVRGWKTQIYAALVAILGVIEITNFAELIPDGSSKGFVLLGIAVGIAVMRALTTTPMGQSE